MDKLDIFPKTPSVSVGDRTRLEKLGYLSCWNSMNKALTKNNPDATDLKKLAMLELERTAPRRPMVEKFVVRMQKREREDIFNNIRVMDGGKRMMASAGGMLS